MESGNDNNIMVTTAEVTTWYYVDTKHFHASVNCKKAEVTVIPRDESGRAMYSCPLDNVVFTKEKIHEFQHVLTKCIELLDKENNNVN